MKNRLLLAALMAASTLMSGCVVAPADPYYDHPVRVAPPPLRHEYPGYAPAPDYVWLSGYWSWGGIRYDWVPGRWEAPRHGHIWVPHRWDRDGDHWRPSGGRWEPDHRPRVAPAPQIIVPQPMPRPERDSPPRREWGGDARNPRDVQVMPQRVEPRAIERSEGPRYEQRGVERPGAVHPAYRPEARQAPAPMPDRGSVQRENRSRGGDRDGSRFRQRPFGDDR